MALHQVPTRVNFTSSSAIAVGICHPTNSAGRMSHQRHGRVVNRFLQNCGLDCVTPLRDPTFIRIANLVACTHLCRTNCFRMHLLSFPWFVCPTRQNLQQTFSAPRHDLLGFSDSPAVSPASNTSTPLGLGSGGTPANLAFDIVDTGPLALVLLQLPCNPCSHR